MLLLHLKLAIGFISVVGDANSGALKGRVKHSLSSKKALLMIMVDSLHGAGAKMKRENCCKRKGVHCSKQTGHVLELDLG